MPGLAGDAGSLTFGSSAEVMSDPEEAEASSLARHTGSLGPALEFARTVDLAESRTLLDIAGGSGPLSITLRNRYPESAATIIDFPNMIEVPGDDRVA